MQFFENIIKIWDKYHMLYLEGLWGTLWISVVVVLCGTLLGTLTLAVMNNLLTLMGVDPFLREAFKGFIVVVAVLLQKKESNS